MWAEDVRALESWCCQSMLGVVFNDGKIGNLYTVSAHGRRWGLKDRWPRIKLPGRWLRRAARRQAGSRQRGRRLSSYASLEVSVGPGSKKAVGDEAGGLSWSVPERWWLSGLRRMRWSRDSTLCLLFLWWACQVDSEVARKPWHEMERQPCLRWARFAQYPWCGGWREWRWRRQGRQGGSRSSRKWTSSSPEPREEEGSKDVRTAGCGSGKGLGNCIFLRINRYFLRKAQSQSGTWGTKKGGLQMITVQGPTMSQRPYQNRADRISLPLRMAVWDVYGEHLFNRERSDLQKPEL